MKHCQGFNVGIIQIFLIFFFFAFETADFIKIRESQEKCLEFIKVECNKIIYYLFRYTRETFFYIDSMSILY